MLSLEAATKIADGPQRFQSSLVKRKLRWPSQHGGRLLRERKGLEILSQSRWGSGIVLSFCVINRTTNESPPTKKS